MVEIKIVLLCLHVDRPEPFNPCLRSAATTRSGQTKFLANNEFRGAVRYRTPGLAESAHVPLRSAFFILPGVTVISTQITFLVTVMLATKPNVIYLTHVQSYGQAGCRS